MGLKDLKLLEEIVKTPGGDFAVRGVSLQDAVQLIRHHGPVLTEMFQSIMSGKDVKVSLTDFSKVGQELLAKAPQAAAELIALASDEGDPKSIKVASRLPFPVQLEAVEKIGKLTFIAEGGLPKFLETVIRIAQGTGGAMAELQKPLTNGSAHSAPM